MARHRDLYRLDHRHLGIGGQAHVFRGFSRDTGEAVALKRVREPSDPDAIARMRREVDAALALHECPHIVPVIDHDPDDYVWMVMPLADCTLGEVALPLPDDDFVEVMVALLSALEAAHALGFVHRDVKPSNVLLLAGRWVLADWGCVRRPPGLTTKLRTEAFLGTAAFAAPEAWDGAHDLTPQSDLYSLGRIAGWALTGQFPRPNISLVPPGKWASFVATLTERKPDARPKSAAAARSLLNAIKDSADSSAAFAARIAGRAQRIHRAKESAHAASARAKRDAELVQQFSDSLLAELLDLIESRAAAANEHLPESHQLHVDREPTSIMLRCGALNYCVRHHHEMFRRTPGFYAQVVITRSQSWRRNDVQTLGHPKWPLAVSSAGAFVWRVGGRQLTTPQAAEHVVESLLDLRGRD